MNRYRGPYTRPDGRKFMVVLKPDGTKSTTLYSRYLMSQHLGRELGENETVDHINKDKTDDRIENFQILSRADHARKDARPAELVEFVCPNCKETVVKPASKVRHNRKQGKIGPFCSRKCAGQYTRF